MREELQQQITELRMEVEALKGLALRSMQDYPRGEAGFDAIKFLVWEVAKQLGCNVDHFNDHFQLVYQRYLAIQLEKIEHGDQSLAARLDQRSVEETDTGECIPPLFPD